LRNDLDRLMRERGLAGMVVFANDCYSPAMHYVTGQRIHFGLYLRAADGRAHLIHDPMERDAAAKAGCEHSGFPQHGLNAIQDAEGHPARGFGRLAAEALATLQIQGRIALYGEVPVGYGHAMVERMIQLNPGLSVDLSSPDLLSLARITKDPDEVEAIRRAARGTVEAMGKLRAFLQSLRRDGEQLRDGGGRVVKLGDLRRLVLAEFLARGLAEDGESILSQGRDAGVPHNIGNDDAPLTAGQPLIVDIFPGEAGGGYHSDMTRTFCMGPAPAPLRKVYDDTHAVFDLARQALKVGETCRSFQQITNEAYEARGHVTRLTNEATQIGYCHNLGHGVGLSVHESPLLGGTPANLLKLEPGMVVTVEPGLYYPDQGIGVRIEDLIYVRPDGTFENLTPFAYDLEIEPRG
jgi:Xaa-Pro aminopeptidase